MLLSQYFINIVSKSKSDIDHHYFSPGILLRITGSDLGYAFAYTEQKLFRKM